MLLKKCSDLVIFFWGKGLVFKVITLLIFFFATIHSLSVWTFVRTKVQEKIDPLSQNLRMFMKITRLLKIAIIFRYLLLTSKSWMDCSRLTFIKFSYNYWILYSFEVNVNYISNLKAVSYLKKYFLALKTVEKVYSKCLSSF